MSVRVGVKDLREHLAEWLDRAESGEEILVTERGRPKARILGATAETTLERLAREGLVTLPKRSRRPLPAPIPGVEGSPVTDAILDARKRSL